jgi:hypothetical protein
MFVDKVKSLPLEWSRVAGSNQVGLSLALRSGVKVTDSNKVSSLLLYNSDYGCKTFYSCGLKSLPIECGTVGCSTWVGSGLTSLGTNNPDASDEVKKLYCMDA